MTELRDRLYLLLRDAFGKTLHNISDRMFNMFNDIATSYNEPHRFYHNLVHIENGLDILDRCNASHATKLAFWFHDVSYVAGAGGNEEISANVARQTLGIYYNSFFTSGDGVPILDEVERLILVTKDHKPSYPDVNGAHMVLADLYGLAADRDTYVLNGGNIRKEYSQYTDEEWAIGRRAFLNGMLDRPRIFPPGQDYTHLEVQARVNIGKELEGIL